jgi:hypothetical protein
MDRLTIGDFISSPAKAMRSDDTKIKRKLTAHDAGCETRPDSAVEPLSLSFEPVPDIGTYPKRPSNSGHRPTQRHLTAVFVRVDFYLGHPKH